tara:strand:+ start:7086 stop:8003 length:918 start_codon:yes stop_codon:yes gene_type:complete
LKVLITGVNGFVGKNLFSYLIDRGFKVLGTDLYNTPLQGDLTDETFVFGQLSEMSFDAIVHLGGIVEIQKTIENPFLCYKINDLGTLNVLELAARNRVKRFIYASSANVFGLPIRLPVRETTPFNPRTPYDHSKVIGESLVNSYYLHRSVPTVILRSWKLYGEHDNPNSAIPKFIEACLEGKKIFLHNAGTDVTDPVYIQTYCEIIELCLLKEQAVGEAFNVGGGKKYSIREIAERIRFLMKSKSKLYDLPSRSSVELEPMKSYPSITKIRKRLGYSSEYDLDEGLKRTIVWFTRHQKTVIERSL